MYQPEHWRSEMMRQAWKVLLVVVVAMVLSVTAPVGVLAADGTLRVDGCTTVDTAVVVRVANAGSDTQSAVLLVTAIVDGVPVTAAQAVTVAGRSAAYASVDFGSEVDLVLTVRMEDGGDPI